MAQLERAGVGAAKAGAPIVPQPILPKLARTYMNSKAAAAAKVPPAPPPTAHWLVHKRPHPSPQVGGAPRCWAFPCSSAHSGMHAFACVCVHARVHMHMYKLIHMCRPTCASTRMLAHANAHLLSLSHMRAHAHTRMHARTHTHTHTHTHVHPTRTHLPQAAPSYDALCAQIRGVQRQYTCGTAREAAPLGNGGTGMGGGPEPGRPPPLSPMLDHYISGLDGPALHDVAQMEGVPIGLVRGPWRGRAAVGAGWAGGRGLAAALPRHSAALCGGGGAGAPTGAGGWAVRGEALSAGCKDGWGVSRISTRITPGCCPPPVVHLAGAGRAHAW